MTNEELREVTGNVKGNAMEAFFYILMRDHLPVGVVEKLVRDEEESNGKEILFTNGYLANYSKLLTKRLLVKYKLCSSCGGSGRQTHEYSHGRTEVVNCSFCGASGKVKRK